MSILKSISMSTINAHHSGLNISFNVNFNAQLSRVNFYFNEVCNINWGLLTLTLTLIND